MALASTGKSLAWEDLSRSLPQDSPAKAFIREGVPESLDA
jgi:hypothetical protein